MGTSSYMTIAPGLSEKQVAAIARVAHKGRIPAHVVDMPSLMAERDIARDIPKSESAPGQV